MLQVFIFLLTALLLAGCGSKTPGRKFDEPDATSDAVMICCPVKNGLACEWLTEAEDGKQKMALARMSLVTGVTAGICPL